MFVSKAYEQMKCKHEFPASRHRAFTGPSSRACTIHGMSMSEPFLPAREPGAQPDPRDREIDQDVDVLPDAPPTDDADADAVHEGAPRPPFRTPEPHAGLTAERLAEELGGND
jgi:hypothetical protein